MPVKGGTVIVIPTAPPLDDMGSGLSRARIRLWVRKALAISETPPVLPITSVRGVLYGEERRLSWRGVRHLRGLTVAAVSEIDPVFCKGSGLRQDRVTYASHVLACPFPMVKVTLHHEEGLVNHVGGVPEADAVAEIDVRE